MISHKVITVIKEFVDLIDIGTDDIPNSEQKGEFAKEGADAALAMFGLAGDLPKSEYDEALEMLGLALVAKVAENKVKHSDGSGYIVQILATAPPELPTEEEVEPPDAPAGEDHTGMSPRE